MEHAQDSTNQPTGAETADSTAQDGQDAGTISKARFDGLMSSMGQRTRERDEARAELERLRELVATGRDADEPGSDAVVNADADDGGELDQEAQGASDDDDDDTGPAVMARPEWVNRPILNPRSHVDPNSAPRYAPQPVGDGNGPGLNLLREQFARAAEAESARLRAEVESSY